MSRSDNRILNRLACPTCKWTDGKWDQQLLFDEYWSNQYGWGVTVACRECGHVNMLTSLYIGNRFQVVDVGRRIPTSSILPF